jgi:hypothetical protein
MCGTVFARRPSRQFVNFFINLECAMQSGKFFVFFEFPVRLA